MRTRRKWPSAIQILYSNAEPILGNFYNLELTLFKYLEDRARSRQQDFFFNKAKKNHFFWCAHFFHPLL